MGRISWHDTDPEVDPLAKLAEDMATALREEHATDEQGRRYRVNHAVRVSKAGVQYTFWAIMKDAPRDHMQKAFIQRRGNPPISNGVHS